jgi:hypothetical protein
MRPDDLPPLNRYSTKAQRLEFTFEAAMVLASLYANDNGPSYPRHAAHHRSGNSIPFSSTVEVFGMAEIVANKLSRPV